MRPFFCFLSLLLMSTSSSSDTLKIDFGIGKNGQNWRTVNDGVMGGLSRGVLKYEKDFVHYEGKISLDNNGGFSSFRSPYQNFDLSEYKSLKLRYRLKGMDFAFTMALDQRFYMPNFKQDVPNTDFKWNTIELPIDNFKKHRMGYKIGGSPSTKELDRVIRIGFISNEKREAPFEFEIDYIEFKK